MTYMVVVSAKTPAF